MGASGSVVSLTALSATEIGEMVASLGGAPFQDYKNAFIENGISGQFIANTSESEFTELLPDLGVTNKIHTKVIMTQFQNIKQLQGNNGSSQSSGDNQLKSIRESVPMSDTVTEPPRTIMSKLFMIQGIKLDPSDLDPAFQILEQAIGKGHGDGVTSFDCFINYRVASESDVSEKLYLHLKSKGIHAFLDRKCLRNGENWKDGFLTGLRNSHKFVALISRAALDKVRDENQDHTYDNVLLEYEMALKVMDATHMSDYIVPVHVGHYANGVLTKFGDFNPAMYPDSVISHATQAALTAESRAKAAREAMEAEAALVAYEKAQAEKRERELARIAAEEAALEAEKRRLAAEEAERQEILAAKRRVKIRFDYENGDRYEGNVDDTGEIREGVGICYYDYENAGDVYEGEWQNDKRNGRGKCTYREDYGRIIHSVYDGEWKDDKRHGEGILTYENGDVLEGRWRDGEPFYAKKTYANGDTYEGRWRNFNRNGMGKATDKEHYDGALYEGEWSDGELVQWWKCAD